MMVSLKQAARISGIPEAELRRRILEGTLAARAVDDGRQYLVRLEDLGIAAPPPRRKSRFVVAGLALLLLLVLLPCTGTSSAICIRCGRVEVSESIGLFVVRRQTGETGLARWIGATDCGHRWVREDRGRRELLGRIDLRRAAELDPEGTPEFARWLLRPSLDRAALRHAVERHYREDFQSASDFRAWAAEFHDRVTRGCPGCLAASP
jgi:hypothetical protein